MYPRRNAFMIMPGFETELEKTRTLEALESFAVVFSAV